MDTRSATTRVRGAVLAALIVLACLVALLALPPIQVRLARLIASKVAPEAGIEIGSLWAGPRGIELGGFRIVTPSTTLSVERADVDLAFWSSLTRLRLDVERAHFEGVDVRLERPAPNDEAAVGAPAGDAEQFAGLQPWLRMPAKLIVRELTATGTVMAYRASAATVEGRWQVAGNGFAPGGTASAEVRASVDARRADEPVAAADIALDAHAEFDSEARITAAKVVADLRPRARAGGLVATASVAIEHQSEHYIATVDGRETGERIAQVDATFHSGHNLDGRWQANATPGLVAAFARGRSVADFSGTSTGEVRADLAAQRAQIETATRLVGRGWEVFDPRLVDLGELRVAIDADATIEPERVDVRRLEIGIASAARGDLLRIVSLQRLRWHGDSWLVEPETRGEPALRLQATALPLEWLKPFSPGQRLQAGELSGTLDLVRSDARNTTLVATEPLRATGVELTAAHGVPVPVLDVTLVPRATLRDGTLEAEIEQLTIAAANGLEIDFEGLGTTSRAEWPVASFEGSVVARVPALQRIMPQLERLRATTRLQLDFATLDLRVASAEMNATARNGRVLFAVDLSGQEPLVIQLPRFTPDWDAFEPQTVALRLDRMPIDWLGRYMPELALRGGEVSGRFTAVGGGGQGLTLQTEEPLVIANLTPVYRGRRAKGAWTATARPRLSLTSASSSFALEDIVMRDALDDRIRGALTVEAPMDRPISIDASFAADFPSLSRYFGTRIGTLRVRQRAELERETRRFKLHELALDIADATGGNVLSVRNLQPFFVTAEPFGVSVDGGSGRILRASVTPLRLEDLLPSLLGFELEGSLPRGEFFGSATLSGDLVLAADEPLQFRDVTVRWGDATLLERVTTDVRYEVVYSAAGVEARSVDLALASADGEPLARASTRAVVPLTSKQLLKNARLEMSANLAPLSHQPIFADLAPFTSGSVVASFELANRAQTSTILTGMLRDAATAPLGRLPDVALRLEASGVPGKSLQVTLPITVQSAENGRSFMELRGLVAQDAAGSRDFDVTLAGERIVARDLEKLGRMLSLQSSAVEPSSAERVDRGSADRRSAIAKLRTQRHDVPIWTERVRGTGAVDIGSIVLPSFTIDGVRGRLDVSADQASVSGVEASMLGAALTVGATVGFDAAAPEPYTLDLDARIGNLELDRLFLAVVPDEPPTAEGLFDIDMAFRGTGLNPIDLGLSTLGEIHLSGRDGVFRGLAASAGTGSTAAGALGALTFSRELRAVGRLLDGLGEIRFAQAEVTLDRTALGSLDLKQLLVVSPQLRLEGAGKLAREPEQPLVDSALDLSAGLAARGDVAVLLDGMKLLEEHETDGYRELTRPIPIRGTLAAPDASAFWDLLDEGAAKARGSFGFTLRMLNRKLQHAYPTN